MNGSSNGLILSVKGQVGKRVATNLKKEESELFDRVAKESEFERAYRSIWGAALFRFR